MARVKTARITRKKHKKVLKQAFLHIFLCFDRNFVIDFPLFFVNFCQKICVVVKKKRRLCELKKTSKTKRNQNDCIKE